MTTYASDGAGGVDAAKVAGALGDADALIDRHLASRYRLPLSAPDAGLTRIACDVARYALRGDELKPDSIIAVNYQTALRQLLALAAGVTQLQAAGLALPEAPGSGVAFRQAPRVCRGWPLDDHCFGGEDRNL
jgi:phage gp36-like protein